MEKHICPHCNKEFNCTEKMFNMHVNFCTLNPERQQKKIVENIKGLSKDSKRLSMVDFNNKMKHKMKSTGKINDSEVKRQYINKVLSDKDVVEKMPMGFQKLLKHIANKKKR